MNSATCPSAWTNSQAVLSPDRKVMVRLCPVMATFCPINSESLANPPSCTGVGMNTSIPPKRIKAACVAGTGVVVFRTSLPSSTSSTTSNGKMLRTMWLCTPLRLSFPSGVRAGCLAGCSCPVVSLRLHRM